MVATTGPNLGVSSGWSEGEGSWATPMNANLTLFDTVIHLSVKQTLSTPPSAPAVGERYMVGASPTGAWIGHTNEIAVYRNSAWSFYAPKVGWRVAVQSAVGANRYREYDGSAWSLEQANTPNALAKASASRLFVGGFFAAPQPVVYRRFVRFNGLDQYVDFGNLPEVTAGIVNDYTIWSRTRLASLSSGSDSDQRPMVFSGKQSPQMRVEIANMSPAGSVGLYLEFGSGPSNITAVSGPVPLNQFFNAAQVLRPYPGAEVQYREGRSYVDGTGTPDGSMGLVAIPTTLNFAAPFRAASYTDGVSAAKRFLNGDIESMAIWNRGLTVIELQQLVDGAAPTSISGLLSYWDFNEGTGTTIGNKVSGGGAGSLVGGPIWMEEGKESAYIVGAGATGAWAGKDGMLALADNGTWSFMALRAGQEVFDVTTGKLYKVTVTSGVVGFTEVVAPVEEAPNDGQTYGRKSKAWIATSGGDLVVRQQWTRPWRGTSVSLATAPGAFTFPDMIAWDTVNIDSEAAYAGGSPKRLTVPANVTKVRLRAGIVMSGAAVTGHLVCGFQKNTELGSAAGVFNSDGLRQSATGFTLNTVNIESPVLAVTAGDYFTVRANSTGLGTIVPQPGSFFEMEVVEAVGAVDDYPIDLAVFIHDKPGASESVMQTVFTRAVNFAINFTGSQAKAQNGATGTSPFQVYKNASNVGAITFAAGSAVGVFVAGSAVTFNPGDVLRVVAPLTPDATLADIALTFTGTRKL